MNAKEYLKALDYDIRESEADTRTPIDFTVSDEAQNRVYDNVAWVWGDMGSLDWECTHPSDLVEYEDDDEVGECQLCGALCEWHYEINEDDDKIVRERVPHDWKEPKELGGLIKRYITETYETKRKENQNGSK